MVKHLFLITLLVASTIAQPADSNSDTQKLLQNAQTAGDARVGGIFHIDSPCPAGQVAYDNCVAPSNNGCGPQGSDTSLAQSFPYNDVLSICCNQHDTCYGSCGGPNFEAHFKQCNDRFKTCMYNQCERQVIIHQEWYLRAAMETICKLNAYAYWKAVVLGGRLSYEASQRKHCGCYDPQVESQPSC